MTSYLRHTIQVRIKKILDEVSGVVSQSNITSWELNFLRDLQAKGILVGSEKQNAIVDRIGNKIFDEVDWAEYVRGREIK